MVPRMTRARTAAKGLVTPPPLHRWMEAVLLLCVSLVQGAVSTLKMIFVPRARECHTEPTHDALPHATSSIPATESRSPTTHISPEALMVSSAHRARPSNHAGELTALSASGSVFTEHASPAKAGVQPPRNARTIHSTCNTPLASGSRAARASGMTPVMRLKISAPV